MNAQSRLKNYGQNFLIHNGPINDMVGRVAHTSGPILEIGPGGGALTRRLATLERPLTTLEIDPHYVRKLTAEFADTSVAILGGDFLSHRLADDTRTIVSNLPFNICTAVLRKLFDSPHWSEAILLLQRDVARRRAGGTLLSTQWAPWFDLRLGARVPAAAFRPRPRVGGGILQISRRPRPLVPVDQRTEFQAMVERVYTGRGRGIAEILTRQKLLSSRRQAQDFCRHHDLSPMTLPPQLPAPAWIALFETTGVSPPSRPRHHTSDRR